MEPADRPRGAHLVLVTGLPGTGKSTVADAVAHLLGGAVLGHDWAMSALRPFDELASALDGMARPRAQSVGWSVLGALARANLRRGAPVVVDGVARAAEVQGCREAAAAEGAAFTLVHTVCSDVNLHRARLEGRRRRIPGWPELEWGPVGRARATWVAPPGADLTLDAVDPWPQNNAALSTCFASSGVRTGLRTQR